MLHDRMRTGRDANLIGGSGPFAACPLPSAKMDEAAIRSCRCLSHQPLTKRFFASSDRPAENLTYIRRLQLLDQSYR